jgi:hypothetical protein
MPKPRIAACRENDRIAAGVDQYEELDRYRLG